MAQAQIEAVPDRELAARIEEEMQPVILIAEAAGIEIKGNWRRFTMHPANRNRKGKIKGSPNTIELNGKEANITVRHRDFAPDAENLARRLKKAGYQVDLKRDFR